VAKRPKQRSMEKRLATSPSSIEHPISDTLSKLSALSVDDGSSGVLGSSTEGTTEQPSAPSVDTDHSRGEPTEGNEAEPTVQEGTEPRVYWQSNVAGAGQAGLDRWVRGRSLLDAGGLAEMPFLPEFAQLGLLQPSCRPEGDKVFINTHEPFCSVVVGVQGAGKSHTTNAMIESCTFDHPPAIRLSSPMATLICHFDQSNDAVCEAAGITSSGALILVSPSNFQERRAAYGKICNAVVAPLLFDFSGLSAVELKQIMGTGGNGNQLYMTVILTLLRKNEKTLGARKLTLANFKQMIEEDDRFQSTQKGPLQQRLDLLAAFMFDADENRPLRKHYITADQIFKKGRMVICDLTDSLLDMGDANRIFQVMLNKFERAPITGGKLVAFDEAHKYLEAAAGDLCHDVVRLVRQMRHYGMRVIVSTQSPQVLNPELLELSSFVVMHRFFSPDWFSHLQRKIVLPSEAAAVISTLPTGEALVYSPTGAFRNQAAPGALLSPHLHRVLVRNRLTRDLGGTVLNAQEACLTQEA